MWTISGRRSARVWRCHPWVVPSRSASSTYSTPSSLTIATLLVLGGCSSSSDHVYDASIIRPGVIASLEDPESSLGRAWVSETGAVPENDSFRQYVDIASNEEIERAAKGACEALEESQGIEIGMLQGDADGLAGAPSVDRHLQTPFAPVCARMVTARVCDVAASSRRRAH